MENLSPTLLGINFFFNGTLQRVQIAMLEFLTILIETKIEIFKFIIFNYIEDNF